MHDLLHTLTEELADRRATTPGERRAARWLADTARRHTFLVWLEPFGSFRSPRPAWGAIVILALLGGGLVWRFPGVALGLTLLAALTFAVQSLGWLELGWIFPAGESQNVVGVVPARKEIRQRVVVVAHYDTGSQPWTRPAFQGTAAGVFALPLAAMLATALPGPLWDGLVLLAMLGVTAGLIRLIQGAAVLSNDAGVAAALAVGRASPMQHTEIWTVFTGSRVPGLVGIQAFLHRHGRLLEGAYFIVLEEQGSMPPRWRRHGEASVIRALGYRALALLEVDRADVRGTVARVRAIAEEIDRRAGGEIGA